MGTPWTTEKDFDLIKTVYLVAMILGLEDVFASLAENTVSNPAIFPLWSLVTAMTLVLFGGRFFWSVRNVHRSACSYVQGEKKRNLRRRIVLLDFPVLLLQGTLFYVICSTYRSIMCPDVAAGSGLFSTLSWTCAAFLLLNVIWLITLGKLSENPEKWWILNNVVFAILLFANPWTARYFCWTEFGTLGCVCVLLFANASIDLWKTHPHYEEGEATS